MVEQAMDWQQVAPGFEPDGSLRDIYVFKTDLSDWQQVLDALINWEPSPELWFDGEAANMPDKVEDIFVEAQRRKALLCVNVGGVPLHCHFFAPNEIEFDLVPQGVTGPKQFQPLVTFIRMLGRTTRKAVVLTMENSRESVIFRFSPDVDRFDWYPP
jgi:hypothetical protein